MEVLEVGGLEEKRSELLMTLEEQMLQEFEYNTTYSCVCRRVRHGINLWN